jgi:hypothetical protein
LLDFTKRSLLVLGALFDFTDLGDLLDFTERSLCVLCALLD